MQRVDKLEQENTALKTENENLKAQDDYLKAETKGSAQGRRHGWQPRSTR